MNSRGKTSANAQTKIKEIGTPQIGGADRMEGGRGGWENALTMQLEVALAKNFS